MTARRATFVAFGGASILTLLLIGPLRSACRRASVLALASSLVLGSCADREPPPGDRPGESPSSCDEEAARKVVERMGERLQRVALATPDTVAARQVRDAYAALVTPDLLATWESNPGEAPGRRVSSPWPERIEVETVTAAGGAADGCIVEGNVVYQTSLEATRGGASSLQPVTLRVEEHSGWRVASYREGETSPAAGSSPAADSPLDVLRRYYEAIAARDYARAYGEWADDGAASGQTLQEFAAGFAETERVDVEIGNPGRVEGAAGSRFVDVPVVIRAETVDGRTQRFEGTYTLRRSVVEGASRAQREWQIHSADIREVR